jgi:hypothetical protein
MARELLPAEASENARAALAAAGFTGLAINSQRNGTDYVTTTVRVSVGDADRVLAILRNLSYRSGSGTRRSGKAYEVWISRRVGMAGG